MSRYRYLKEDDLVARIRALDSMRTTAKKVERWVSEQPEFPTLIGATAAGKILGVPPSHITRLRERGRMRGIPVLGGYDIYDRHEVEQLAKEIAKERAERAAKRAEA
jgi:hypothetical protein